MSGKIISSFCYKGGVGKTTLSVLLAQGLVNLGKKVLVIDLDETPMASEALVGRNVLARDIPAHNSSSAFFCSLMQQAEVSEIPFIRNQIESIKPPRGIRPQLSLLPGSEYISDDEDRIVGDLLKSNRVAAIYQAHDLAKEAAAKGIKQCAKHFDLTIVDCPPRSTDFCKGAVQVADLVVVPYIPDGVAFGRIQRTGRLTENVQTEEELDRIPIEKRRYMTIANRVQTRRSSLHSSNIEAIRAKHPYLFFDIPDKPQLATALQKDMDPLTLREKYKAGAKIIEKFIDELMALPQIKD